MALPTYIGQTGGAKPTTCASTGQPLEGKHAVTYAIRDNTYYYRVVSKAQPAWQADYDRNHARVEAELDAALNPPIETKTTKTKGA
jgi:hypothetical protein